ncbi:MAG: aminotransferase class V-fold PLP-dependent enzyme [candidate division KSB1 bacterium]|nr:aminotransferase class V-fold PLP-dependent enzyme [candidate division KSB1 bacterium]MDZ7304453.1 aminotransferase class V-fold PLP-dependent enzyme [candidate division KSB1 bacterium]MDZ7310946.1 aminotransferase class V-fold PLP-dependent enzyme [candidate division KSB1 bacterium]
MQRRTFINHFASGFAALLGAPLFRNETLAKLRDLDDLIREGTDATDERYWTLVREQFPLTRERIYLNTGGLGASPYVVIDAVFSRINELERISETGHSEQLWLSIKQKAAALLGCEAEEIAYTRNATEGINIVCNGLPLQRGDEVITTTHEHVGNAVPWLARQKHEGIVLKLFEPSTKSAQENLDRIERLISKRTRVISVPHATTTTGQVLSVKEIAKMAKAKNLWFFIDGAQTAGMLPFNLHEIGCDAYATSGHKWLLGPKGTGLLYVRKDMLEVIQAKWVGAYSDAGHNLQTGELKFHPTAQRYEYGTVSTPLFVGLGAGIDFLLKIGLENVWARDAALSTALLNGLKEIPAVEILSPLNQAERSAMITFKMKNIEYLKLQSFLAEKYKLRTRGVGEAGLKALRLSWHIYNSFEEVNRVLEGVQEAAKL